MSDVSINTVSNSHRSALVVNSHVAVRSSESRNRMLNAELSTRGLSSVGTSY